MTRWFPLLLLPLAVVGCKKDDPEDTSPTTTTTTPPEPVVQITPLGTPKWEVGSVVLFTGPAGDGTQTCLLSGNHTFDDDLGVWAPAAEHEPPYETEIADKLADCGLTLVADMGSTGEVFLASADMESPSGVWLGLMIVPQAGNAPGSSPDFGLGDVIYDDRFPMVVDADVRRGEPIVDSDNDFIFPKPGDWGYVVTGHSHVPMLFRTSLERMPAGASSPGSYTWNVSVRDATDINTDAGVEIVVPYTVTDSGGPEE